MAQFIFVIRKSFSNNYNDYKFMDKQTLLDILKSPTRMISEYQYGFINPENDRLCIHELDTETLRVMFELGDE